MNGGAAMLNTFSGWLFNVLLLGALAGLCYHTFAAPILYDALVPLVALGVVAVVALFWPKF
jgi:hypothetical protein